MMNDSLLQSLHSHLAEWGLRQFTSDESYFQWQRDTLSPSEITALHQRIEGKRSGSSVDEVSLYDAAAHPKILPQHFAHVMERTTRAAAGGRLDAQALHRQFTGLAILDNGSAARIAHALLGHFPTWDRHTLC
ncbi:MAG TPA: hypothetical protein VLL06_07255 [Nitrospiraceae bacterium]|nr:hypothetical protein [Nitrospiraceae bacterium]